MPATCYLQLKRPSHPSRGIPTAVNSLATLLKEPVVRSFFVQSDGVKLLIPLITPASTQQSIQVTLTIYGLFASVNYIQCNALDYLGKHFMHL